MEQLNPETNEPILESFTMANLSLPPANVTVSNEALPIIALVSPSSSDTVGFGSETIIQASVSPLDPNSSLTVEFFVDDVSIGIVRSVPFAIPWTPATTGLITLRANLTEGDTTVTSAEITVNSIVGSQLGVEILTPSDFSEFDIGDDALSLTSRVSTSSGNATVEYFANGVTLGSSSVAPFTVTWSPQTAGTFIITAKVSEANSSRTLTSGGALVQVFNSPEPRPTVNFASPIDDDTIPTNVVTTIAVAANSQAGTIQQVEFRLDGVSIGFDSVYPYTASFTASTASDEILLQAIATDSFGNIASQAITISAADIAERVNLVEPTVGLQFSVFEDVSLSAQVNATAKAISGVEFLANGVAAVSRSFPPFEETFSTTVAGDYLFSARVTYADGSTLTSPAVATQGVVSPLSNFADFVVQAFLDFTGQQPNDQILQEVLEDVPDSEAGKVTVIQQILNASDGISGVSIMGAYQTLLRRFPDPAEYQTALLSLSGDTGGGGGGAIPISIGDTVNGQFSNNTFDNIVTYVFTVTEAQSVTAFVTSPVFVNILVQDSAGNTIAISDNGFFALNPVLTATLPSAGTYFLVLDGLGSSVGAFTLTLSGSDSGGGGGVGGAFRLGPIIDGIFTSDEYLAKFGPVPNITISGLVGEQNRQEMVRQTYLGKYGGEPNDFQLVQGSVRISVLGGVTEYVEVLVSEATFETGDALLAGAGTRRPYWTTSLLVMGFFNEQPPLSAIAQFEDLSLSNQITSMLADPRYTSRFPPAYSLLFAGDVNAQGWVDSPWMSLVNVMSAPWYYQIDLGWIFTSAEVAESVWYYSPGLGWIWTSDKSYPFIYINDEAGWFYVLGSQDGFVFLYDTSTGDVVTRFVG